MDEQKSLTSGTVPEISAGDKDAQASHSLRPDATAKQSADLSLGEIIFLGPQGLRVVWRLLLFLGFGIVIFYIERTFLSIFLRDIHLGLWMYVIGESELFLAVLGASIIMSLMEGRDFGAYGLPVRFAFKKLFWVGALWGIVSLSVLLLAMRVLGAFHLHGLAIHGARIFKFALFYGLFFLIVGFFEEFLFRGYLLFTLGQGIGFWPAAVVLSIAFGAIHIGNTGESWIGVAAVVFIGLFWCLTLRRTGNLWFAVGLHSAWDWGETYLYSVPDSGGVMPGHLTRSFFHGSRWITGGSVGPEGSVLIFGLLVIMWALFQHLYKQNNYAV